MTHSPEDSVRDHYRLNGITLVELRLESDEILSDVTAKLVNADNVQLCPDRKRCAKCGHYQQPIQLKIFDAPCYSCNSKMKVPFIEGDHSRGSHIGPDEFSQKEIALARNNGALIEWQYSRTLNTKYWAVTCGRCKKFIGRNHLCTEYIAPAYYEDSVVEVIKLGDFCEPCYRLKFEHQDESM